MGFTECIMSPNLNSIVQIIYAVHITQRGFARRARSTRSKTLCPPRMKASKIHKEVSHGGHGAHGASRYVLRGRRHLKYTKRFRTERTERTELDAMSSEDEGI